MTSYRMTTTYLPELARSLAFNPDGGLLAASLSGPQTNTLLSIHEVPTLAIRSELVSSSLQCLGACFSAGNDSIFFLAEADNGNFELFRSDVSLRAPTKLAEYGIGERCHSLVADGYGHYFSVVGNFVEVWDTSTATVVRHISKADPNPGTRAVFLPSGHELCIYGLEPEGLVVWDIVENRSVRQFAESVQSCKQLVASFHESYVVVVSEGTTGVLLYDTSSFVRRLPERFNEDTLTGFSVFIGRDTQLVTISRRGFSGRTLPEGRRVEGLRYDPSNIVAVASTVEGDFFALTQQDGALRLLEVI